MSCKTCKHSWEYIDVPGGKGLACSKCGKAEAIADPTKAAMKEVRRQVALAVKTGGTVPYDLRTLIDAGLSLDRIRKVYRG